MADDRITPEGWRVIFGCLAMGILAWSPLWVPIAIIVYLAGNGATGS